MAYILLVNPAMLSGSGMEFDDALFHNYSCRIRRMYSNGAVGEFTIRLGSRNEVEYPFTFTVVIGMGVVGDCPRSSIC